MPEKQTNPVRTRLTVDDRLKFENICRAEGLTEAELARRAIVEMLDRYDQQADAAKRDRLAEAMEAMTRAIEALGDSQKRSTERLAKIGSRALIDVGTIYQVLYARTADDSRERLWTEAKKAAVRLNTKRRHEGDDEATEVMKHALSGEA